MSERVDFQTDDINAIVRARELEAGLDAAQKELDAARKECAVAMMDSKTLRMKNRTFDGVVAELDAARARVGILERGLARYGCHERGCEYRTYASAYPCTCGLSAMFPPPPAPNPRFRS